VHRTYLGRLERGDANPTVGMLEGVAQGARRGPGLNAALGWWWSDPVGALVMVPFIIREGVDALRGRTSCGDGCCR
jgi:hypothetical protein